MTLVLRVDKPEGPLGWLLLGPLDSSQRAVLGRDPGADVRLEHGSVSRQHAAVSVERGGGALITDLGSGARAGANGAQRAAAPA